MVISGGVSFVALCTRASYKEENPRGLKLIPFAASATAASRPIASAAFTHRPGFVDHKRAAQKLLAIAVLNGPVCFLIVGKIRKSETARLTGELVTDDLHGIGLKSGLREPILQFRFAGLIG
jgi:hypothetical protein